MALVTSFPSPAKSFTTPRSAWEPALQAKRFEAQAHKATLETEYRGWMVASQAIQDMLNEGKDRHQRVMIFNMNDKLDSRSYRERILVFYLGEEYSPDGTNTYIKVNYQGAVYKGEGSRRHMTKRQRAFNRMIALRRLATSPRTLPVPKPEAWNVAGYDTIRNAIRRAIFDGLR